METKKRVGLRIKAIRNAKGLTQEEMGALLGRSVDAISNLERGVSHPSFETLELLSEKLDVPVKAFFEFDGGEDDSPERVRLLESLRSAVEKLDDGKLSVAVKQVEALAVGE